MEDVMREEGVGTVEEEGVVAHVICFLSWLLVRGRLTRMSWRWNELIPVEFDV